MAATEVHCKVISRKYITPTVFELAFETDKPVEFLGGQFISIVIPKASSSGKDLRRAYSIASGPAVRPVELCVKLVEGGPGTNYLNQLDVGDTFRGFAPYGDFTYEPRPGRQVMFISTGTGIAPFRSMMLSKEYRQNPPTAATCLLGVRTEDEVLYFDELSQLSDVKYVATVSQPRGEWNGFKGRVTDYLRSLGDGFAWKETDYYLCGGGAMITEVKAILAEKGVEKDAIHQEKYF